MWSRQPVDRRSPQQVQHQVVNFSLHAITPSHFVNDPLDKAVEKLWFSGVVVVTAAGNDGVDGQATAVPYAPANDPFVITVGALDSKERSTIPTTPPLPGRPGATRSTASPSPRSALPAAT